MSTLRDRRAPWFARERGSSAVIVALCGIVVLAAAVIVVDVGALAQEASELQNGADSAALAVARNCIQGSCTLGNGNAQGGEARAGSEGSSGTDATPRVAQRMGDSNATDGAATPDEVCGIGPDLPSCAPAPAAPANSLGAVRVRMRTLDARSGTSILPVQLAQVLGFRGRTVRRSATVVWGGLGEGIGRPLAFSVCEYEAAIARTNILDGPPSDLSGPPSAIFFHDSGSSRGCGTGPSGWDTPGGFGWVRSSGCSLQLTVPATVVEDPGTAVPGGCDLRTWLGKTLLFPVFDQATGTGAGGTLRIVGFASFHVTGYQFPDQRYPVGGRCPGSQSSSEDCLIGYFTRQTLVSGAPFSPQAFGTLAVRFLS